MTTLNFTCRDDGAANELANILAWSLYLRGVCCRGAVVTVRVNTADGANRVRTIARRFGAD